MRYDDLPGAELVLPGIEDLRRGVESVPALLAAIGRPRLLGLGFEVPSHPFNEPEHRLYFRLAAEYDDEAHTQYNILIRRLVCFARSAGWLKNAHEGLITEEQLRDVLTHVERDSRAAPSRC